MASIEGMLKVARRFERDWIKSVSRSLRQNKQVVLGVQKGQLLSGLDVDGRVLAPSISQDPFFVDGESARRYAMNKDKLSAKHKLFTMRAMKRNYWFGSRGQDTPNLLQAPNYTRARYHPRLRVNVVNDTLEIKSTWSKAQKVDAKFPKAMGINPEGVKVLWDEIIRDDLVEYWNELTWTAK